MNKNRMRMLLMISSMFMLFGASINSFAAENSAETFTVMLKDYGDGFILPENFDFSDTEGRIATLNRFDQSWIDFNFDGVPVTRDLGNGYRAVKEYTYQKAYDSGDIYIPQFTVTKIYDENNNIVCSMGLDEEGTAFWGMQDGNGNYAINYYSEADLKFENGRYTEGVHEGTANCEPMINTLAYTREDESGQLMPLSRVVYTAEDDAVREYVGWGEELRLKTKTEYGTDDGTKITEYFLVADRIEGLPQDDPYYANFSYYTKDLITVELDGMCLSAFGEAMYGGHYNTFPTVKYAADGAELHYFIFDNPVENIKDGSSRPDQSVAYFTEEQIEILKNEGINDSTQAYKLHPDFFQMHGVYVNREEVDEEYISEAMKQANKRLKADDLKTENAEEENDKQEGEEEKPEKLEDNTNKDIALSKTRGVWQELVGDVVPVEGKVPKYVCTRVMDNGFIRADLHDANRNMIISGSAFDLEHTKYKYVYLDYFDVLGNGTYIYQVVGTDDAGIRANLGLIGTGETDTENGTTSIESYYNNGDMSEGYFEDFSYDDGGYYEEMYFEE